MRKKLSMRNAWLEIARHFAEDNPQEGLCFQVGEMQWHGTITYAHARKMYRDVTLFEPPTGETFYWPIRGYDVRGADDQRVLAACFLAAGAK